jgi:hypothetical protein
MTARERELFHQLHPAKLLTDWSTAAVAGALLWFRHPYAALAVGWGPSVIVTALFLSGRLDAALERLRERRAVQAIAPRLTADVNAIRFAGLALWWVGCWLHQGLLIPLGILVIAAGWLLAWRRGTRSIPTERV